MATSTGALPEIVVMATIDNSGLAKAKSNAAASSIPGSVSIITFFIINIESLNNGYIITELVNRGGFFAVSS